VKVFLLAHRSENRINRLKQKLIIVKSLFDKYQPCPKNRFLRALADVLLFPESELTTLSESSLVRLISACFDFLEQKPKHQPVHCRIFELNNDKFLLIGCPDVPYVVESIAALQQKLDISFHLLACPELMIQRQGQTITGLAYELSQGEKEQFVLIQVDCLSADQIALLQNEIKKIMIAACQVFDNHALLKKQLLSIKQITEFAKWRDCIDWLAEQAFIPFVYIPITTLKHDALEQQVMEASLGMGLHVCCKTGQTHLIDALIEVLSRDTDVIIQALTIESPLLGKEALHYIGFRERMPDGFWIEHAFLGLCKEIELNGLASRVPVLADKINHLLTASKIHSSRYDFVKVRELLDLFPKIEWFFISRNQFEFLLESLIQYLRRPETIHLVFPASSSPNRISVLLIIPQPLYKKDLESLLAEHLGQHLSCTLENSRTIHSGGGFIGLQLTFKPELQEVSIDVDQLKKSLNKLTRPWPVKLRRLLERSLGHARGGRLWQKYHALFPVDYQHLLPCRYAVRDILQMEALLSGSDQRVELLSPCQQTRYHRLHFYSARERYLDEYIPVLESMDFRLIDQVQFAIRVGDRLLYIKSFAIAMVTAEPARIHRLKPNILSAIQAILDNKLEIDSLNGLIVSSHMRWQEVDVLRAYRNYSLQLGLQITIASFHRALLNNPQAAKSLYCYFEARFRPDPKWRDAAIREEQGLYPARMALLQNMESVHDINDDRILRTLFNLIDATVRSNFHVRVGLEDYFIAFKINSLGVIDMPMPRPQFEIYVHAFDMEGIHLRGGKIARGGIRWSDRRDDFRIEILGLMQTQMSKNALIIPKGAKGGFIVKQSYQNRTDLQQAGKNAYIKLMRGLLDLTDNYVNDKVIRLPGIIPYDDDDPYLVVAADKGTASFPDIANRIAAEYKFWLHDAFASGSSTGYNHKSLGITARGAWESVKRHFRELGKDIQNEAFTVVGIGSMDGDVFGNGMLLSRHTRLLAAVSGQHIFIDPDPDPEISYSERKRLFDLPGSSWADYNPELLSEGGGVYPRDAKNILISPVLKHWLGVRYRALDGESLIRYLLTVPVDLLWLGGIGTYVKASDETHEQAGDRRNDRVRVDALHIKANVVGEGANLGFTQKARIEYNLQGGKINTDAIDNSAGVDISDHEVNLKILFNDLHRNQQITNPQTLFKKISPDVCRAVLENNYKQSLCLSLDQIRCNERPELFMELAERLEAAGLLDRTMASFPDKKVVSSRQNHQLTRPELAVLLAASKLYLKQALLEQSHFIKADYCDRYLQAYFPLPIRERYAQHLNHHPLADNIKATWISNQLIDQSGCTFLHPDITQDNGKIVDFASCYLTFDRVIDAEDLRRAIYALDNKVAADVQYDLLIQLEKVLADFCHWSLLNGQATQPDTKTVACFSRYFAEYEKYFFEHYQNLKDTGSLHQLDEYEQNGINHDLAMRFLLITHLNNFPFIVTLTLESKQNFLTVLQLFNESTEFLGLDKMNRRLAKISLHDQWERSTYNFLQDQFQRSTGNLVNAIIESGVHNCTEYFANNKSASSYKHYQQVYQSVCNEMTSSLLPYITLAKALDKLL